MEESIEQISELNIHGIEYILRVSATERELSLLVEQKNSGEIWTNTFSSEYVEEITQKTGNAKKYKVFMKMLLSAIEKTSESVTLEILTFQDVEMLKARKNQQSRTLTNQSQQISQNASSIMNKKRFAILTYKVEYDKVHYPLPLNFDENPDSNILKQIISRLRLENEVLKTNRTVSSEQSLILSLKQENELLRSKIKRPLEDNQASEQMRVVMNEHQEEIKYLKQILEVKQREITVLKSDNCQLLEHAQNYEEMREAFSKIKEGERVMFQQQQRLEQMDLEMSSILQELETYKNNDKRQKQRILVLESELEGTLNRQSANGSKMSNSLTRGRSSSLNKKQTQKAVITSPLRNSRNNSILNSSGRQTPSNLSRSNSQSKIKLTPSKSNQRPTSSSLKRRNSIDSDTASSRARKPSNNMRGSSPSRGSGNLGSKKSGNTPQKKTIVSSTSRLTAKSPASSAREKNSFNYPNGKQNNQQASSKMSSKILISATSGSRQGNNKNKQNYDDTSDDESRLERKLEELRSKNKENSDSQAALRKSRLLESYKSKESLKGMDDQSSSFNCDNTVDINDKLNNIQELLRKAKI